MSDRQAELRVCAETCKREALRAMQTAEKATLDEYRAELLRIAVEWLKISSELNEMAAVMADA